MMYTRCLRSLYKPVLSASLLRPTRPANILCLRRINTEDKLPWFMREETSPEDNTLTVLEEFPRTSEHNLPQNLPEHLVTLYRHLSQSPLLSLSTLRIYTPSSFKPRNMNNDLTLPYSRAKGRRRRGVHDAGESVGEPNDMWDWYVLAEVKEGTEGRGAIEAVIRNAHKELLQAHPHLPIPKKFSRKRTEDGWGVFDIGDSLLHIVSREASQKWFSAPSNTS
ncbi:hypothetical protein BDV93DRAFT_18477 [Ceratobasidium sp. AG-I]|nr:hypothetical protein BDV93DRAFT_18477 [Ceratobasidium sp. AG-I]